MKTQCVVGVYDSLALAQDALAVLEDHGFSQEQVSLVKYDVEQEVPNADLLQYGDQAESAAAAGAGVGGLAGLLLATPLLAVPGIGPVLIAGPLAAGATGAIVGGLLGSMVGWGVHDDSIEQYDQLIRAGSALVVVSGDPETVARARQVLDETSAAEVHLHAKTSADSVEP